MLAGYFISTLTWSHTLAIFLPSNTHSTILELSPQEAPASSVVKFKAFQWFVEHSLDVGNSPQPNCHRFQGNPHSIFSDWVACLESTSQWKMLKTCQILVNAISREQNLANHTGLTSEQSIIHQATPQRHKNHSSSSNNNLPTSVCRAAWSLSTMGTTCRILLTTTRSSTGYQRNLIQTWESWPNFWHHWLPGYFLQDPLTREAEKCKEKIPSPEQWPH